LGQESLQASSSTEKSDADLLAEKKLHELQGVFEVVKEEALEGAAVTDQKLNEAKDQAERVAANSEEKSLAERAANSAVNKLREAEKKVEEALSEAGSRLKWFTEVKNQADNTANTILDSTSQQQS